MNLTYKYLLFSFLYPLLFIILLGYYLFITVTLQSESSRSNINNTLKIFLSKILPTTQELINKNSEIMEREQEKWFDVESLKSYRTYRIPYFSRKSCFM